MNSSPRSRTVALAVALLAVSACENGIDVRSGVMRVVVNTTGGDADRDGYFLVIDGAPAESVGISAAMSRQGVEEGEHTVELGGVAWNCGVAGPNPRLVMVTAGETVELNFSVSCVATGVRVTLSTSGIDFDADGYRLTVDSGPAVIVEINQVVVISYLSPGAHSVSLDALAANCSAATSSHAVTLVAGDVAPLAFTVTCRTSTGVLRVTIATTGMDLDPDGYQLQVDGGTPIPTNIAGVMAVAGLLPGDHSIALVGAAANCTVGGANPRTATITAGGSARDTTSLAFSATCSSVTGAVAVLVAISGLDPDDSLSVRLDGGPAVRLPGGGSTLTLPGLTIGDHEVRLADVAANCSVAGANPRTMSVSSSSTVRDTARTTFDLSCVARTGVIEVTAATSGFDPDLNGYQVQMDAGSFLPVGPAGTLVLGAGPGTHSVLITGLAPNCLVASNPRQVQVNTGTLVRDTVRTTFAVICSAIFGAVRVTTTTTGTDPDANGYRVRVFGFSFDSTTTAAVNGPVAMGRIPAGDHLVRLDDIAMNCEPTGANPRAVTIVVGDTATLSLDVACQAAPLLAVSNGADLFTVKANGANLVPLASNGTSDADPAWAYDGSSITFSSNRHSSEAELYRVNADGSGLVRLTITSGADYRPSWSPDGSRIVFTSTRSGFPSIWMMNADGSNQVQLPGQSGNNADAVFSPDGSKIVFASTRSDGNFEIYVMNADGSSQTRLTTDWREDVHPAWSPDGLKIVFARQMWCYYNSCDYDLVVMNADGSGEQPLPSGTSDTNPSWSPDGQWIAFGASICDYYYGCWYQSVNAMRSDGTQVIEILNGGYHPAWKP